MSGSCHIEILVDMTYCLVVSGKDWVQFCFYGEGADANIVVMVTGDPPPSASHPSQVKAARVRRGWRGTTTHHLSLPLPALQEVSLTHLLPLPTKAVAHHLSHSLQYKK